MQFFPRLLAALCFAVPCAAQVTVGGDVPHPFTLSDSAMATLPHRTVQAGSEHGQPPASYDGVALRDVLAKAGAPLGAALRGPALATYVLCSAADGYRVVFALAELDSAFTDDLVIIATRKDGQPLSEHEGPARIVAPAEHRPARWIRQLTSITVHQATP
jgi:DMSO/TMAO reductase YedYZ molybdopterin-dependent catalytic subunit